MQAPSEDGPAGQRSLAASDSLVRQGPGIVRAHRELHHSEFVPVSIAGRGEVVVELLDLDWAHGPIFQTNAIRRNWASPAGCRSIEVRLRIQD